jgi:uncharacterized phage infection (PIP) family protein YhgE
VAAGDVKIMIDDGNEANLGTEPAVAGDNTRRLKVILTQAETNGDVINIVFHDAAGSEWCDLAITIHTSAQTFDETDTVADSILTDTTGLNGMTPPTAVQIQTEMEADGASLLDTIRDELANGTDGLSALKTLIDAIQTDLGDFSGRTNDQSLLDVLGVPDVANKDLYTCLITDRLDNGTYGLSAIETLVDSLETYCDILDNGTNGLANIKTLIDAIQTDLGDFSGRTNNQSLLAVLGVPDVSGKDLHTLLVTDRLDHATYGLSAIETLVDDIESRLTATRAGYLDELGSTNLPADVDTLKTYCDILDHATNGLANIKSLIDTINGVVDTILVDTKSLNDDAISELSQAVPTATPTVRTALMLLYMLARNKLTTTSSELGVYNDAGTKISKKTLSDDGTTYTETKMVSGA